MKLNLAHPEQSEISFNITKYPDGQQDFKILYPEYLEGTNDIIEVYSRFNSWLDIEILCCVQSALNNLGNPPKVLHLPYLMGARSDRQFIRGGSSYLKDVIAPEINSLEFDKVVVHDPHSDVTEALIDNLEIVSNLELVKFVVEQENLEQFTVVAPDAGALKKCYKVGDYFKQSVMACSKQREVGTGKILGTSVYYKQFLEEGRHLLGTPFIIIDDICDGGRTFIELAKAFREQGNSSKMILVVTHGIFSKGLDELREYFDKIYCTNSVKDIKDPLVTQLEII